MMTLGAFTVRLPADDWKPKGWDPDRASDRSMVTRGDVTAATAIRTRQFWLLWVVLFCNVTAGIGILEQASPIQDHFSTVTAAAAAGFVGLLSLCNMAGRITWSSTSDVIGRKPMTVPAYLKDLFGTLQVGAIHGRLLTGGRQPASPGR